MKKVLIAFAIFAMANSSAFAQTAASPDTSAHADDRAVSMAKKMQQELSLTDDQYNKILAVNTECMKRRDAIKASGQTGREAFKPVMDYREQQYATILTADQAAKFKDIEANEREQRKAAHDGGSNPGE
jgi:Spy/CpxP family protein refolding chaperone